MKKYLISGSLAYDSIVLGCEDLNHKFPEKFNEDFLSNFKNIQHHYGGTGGNIIYNSVGILKANAKVLTSVGNDFSEYKRHLEHHGISLDYVREHKDDHTPRVVVLTDNEGNQNSRFYSGASSKNVEHSDGWVNDFDFFHLAPDEIKNTLRIGKLLIDNNKSFFVDPGQTIPILVKDKYQDILTFKDLIENAEGVFVNEGESAILEKYFNKQISDIFTEKTKFIVKTLGSKGVEVYFSGGKQMVYLDVCSPEKVVDPTGCGDAFRGGFLSSYAKNVDLLECVKLGNVMGSFAIEKEGGQNHKPTMEEIESRYQKNYMKKLIKIQSLKR